MLLWIAAGEGSLSFEQGVRKMLSGICEAARRTAAAACVAAVALLAAPALVHAQSASAPAVTAPAAAPAAPAAMAAPAAAGTAARTEKVDNPYGLQALWAQSDMIAKVVLVILVLQSIGTWYILIVKLLDQSKMMRQAKAAAEKFWTAGTVKQGAEALDGTSPFRFMADAGLEATKKHSGLLEHMPLSDWVTMSIGRAMERVQSRMQDGLSFLASVGSTAPFIGLFGTVWGIYHALTAIGVSGQASIDKVAGPVGEALIMTAIGLAVAVPAVLGYNWLVRRNKGVMDEVRAFGADLHSVILASAQKGRA
jgi:biopolymer transport protein ExbB